MFYFPTHLYVETSDYCNRACDFCPIQHARDSAPPRLLELSLFEKLLVELRDAMAVDRPIKISLQWIDEPLANPRFFEYVQLGRRLLPKARWLLQTNGDFLNEERVDQLKRSFDAVTINFYNEAAYERFLTKKHDVVPAKFPNFIQPPGRLSPGFGYAKRTDEAIIHANQKFWDEDWIQRHDTVALPSAARCMRPWVQAAVAWDGAVHICCRDNHRDHPVGNLKDQSLYQCFNSEAARALRLSMESGRRHDIKMCKTCPSDFKDRFDALDASAARALSGGDPGPGAHLARAEQLPFGAYDYLSARAWAKRLGHLPLPGVLPYRYEYVVGLTAKLKAALVKRIEAALGEALLGVLVCGSRVMTRPRLALVDPSVFADPDDPLTVGRKDRLREFGSDPRYSSDLDLKVLADEALLSEAQAQALASDLGQAVEPLNDAIPLSGHKEPLLRVHRVQRPPDGRLQTAFAQYNAERFARFKKGRLSLQYTQQLHDPQDPLRDAQAEVFAELQPRHPGAAVPICELALFGAKLPEERWGLMHGRLSYHQLVTALIDATELEPQGVRLNAHGAVVAGRAAVWAAMEAGRETIDAVTEPVTEP